MTRRGSEAHQSITEETDAPAITPRLLDAGKRDGTIPADADAANLLLTGALCQTPTGTGAPAQRMLALILDGMHLLPQG